MLFSFRPGAGEERIPQVGSVEILGPFTADGPERHAEPPARASSASPRPPADEAAVREADPRRTLARRAFRRPVTDQDLAAPMAFYAQGPRRAATSSRHPRGAAGDSRQPEVPVSRRAHAGGRRRRRGPPHHATSSWPRACRSSCWARLPTTSCWRLAEQGTLAEPTVLEAQVRRLLADPRSQSLVTNFAFQWLKMRGARRDRSRCDRLPELRRRPARRRSAARWSCSSTASSARTAACSTC